ncbi:MAG: hypothetical protein CR991_05260 [Proteobacteria bacterium]|nr:MAG: hypothetical protein CR991_05260 [Pseudomonadota bacterium]
MASNRLQLHRRFLAFLCLLISSILSAASAASLEEQRELFQDIYPKVKAGETGEWRTELPKLKSYPLYPWIEYEFLTNHFDKKSNRELVRFAERNPNSIMSDAIYVRMANRFANRRDWSALLKYIPDIPQHTAIQCYRAEALVMKGREAEGLAAGKAIWDKANTDLPSDCNNLLRLMREKDQLTDEDEWDRIGRLIANNYVTVASVLAGNLSAEDQALVKLWIEIRRDPSKNLDKAFKLDDSARLREMIVFGIQRAADKKLSDALSLWSKAQAKFKFTGAEKGAVESRLGMWEAWRHDSDGFKRLKNIPAKYRTAEGNIWLARLALRTGHWKTLLEAVKGLENQAEGEGDKDIWQYWKGRALEKLGHKREARQVYGHIAADATFYGFMAADRLKLEYRRLKEPAPDRSERIKGLEKLASLKRWREWLALGERTQARREWFRLLGSMDKEGILAAAEIASRAGDANLAIWTVSRTRDWNVVDLRFPVLYQDLVLEHSRSQGINPAWILGIMRRESAFDASAESSARALGLMQIMPSTAKAVGRKLGVTVSGREDILQPQMNVKLGSAYLREMYRRFAGNYAQATAAYNAGPRRIPKWTPNKTIEADQWVESIPFNETRRYVRTVMAYTTIYDHKLRGGKGVKLSLRLKPIKPN